MRVTGELNTAYPHPVRIICHNAPRISDDDICAASSSMSCPCRRGLHIDALTTSRSCRRSPGFRGVRQCLEQPERHQRPGQHPRRLHLGRQRRAARSIWRMGELRVTPAHSTCSSVNRSDDNGRLGAAGQGVVPVTSSRMLCATLSAGDSVNRRFAYSAAWPISPPSR